MALALALDFGTGGLRAAVYDTALATKIAEVAEPYETTHAAPGWAEQDPEEWWSCLGSAVHRLRTEAGVTSIEVVCLSTTASTVVYCDEAGNPVSPAILWMDTRASDESRMTGLVEHPILETCGGSCASEWLVPKAMWMSRNRPEVWARTARVCEALDYINYRLTGCWVGSLMNATCKWTYDAHLGAYHPELFEAFGVPELEEKLPPDIVAVGGMIGEVSAEAASFLGLSRRTRVVQGGIDAHVGMFGANTLAPGEMLLIGGTSTVMLTNIPDDGTSVSGFWGPYPHAAIHGLRLIEAGQVSSGSVLKWLTAEIFGLDAAGLAKLNESANALPISRSGLMALDFWMGNRTPLRDPLLRGAILGLSLGHTRADVYNACVTAVALGGLNVTDTLETQGVALDRIVLAGGIVNNPYWLDATIDAIGAPAEIVGSENLTLLGGAVLGATAAGVFDSIDSAADAMLPSGELRHPDDERHEEYREMLQHYRRVTEVLTPELHRLAKAVEISL